MFIIREKIVPNKINSFILPVILSLLLIPEGLGLPYGRQMSFILILIIPVLLLLHEILNKRKKILIPKQITLYFFMFFIFSALSASFSLNKERSFTNLAVYFPLFCTFIYVLNRKEEFERFIPKLILGLSVLFAAYAWMKGLFSNSGWFVTPESGFQFVYSKYGSHNHLGDFLVLTLILIFYRLVKEKGKIYYLYLVLFLPFFLFSYSRTAYVSLAVTLVFLCLYLLKTKVLKTRSWMFGLILAMVISSVIFSVITVREAKLFPYLNLAYGFLTENFNLNDKYFRSKRIGYLDQAVASFKEKPLFGVGLGNFDLASKKYTTNNQWTFSSHNIFLDILAENGLLALIFFILFFTTLFQNIKQFNEFSAMFIGMLIGFQTDYTYSIYSFLFLFFVLMGLVYTRQIK